MAKTLGDRGRHGSDPCRYHRKAFSSFNLKSGEKDIFLTSKAKQLLELVPEDLKTGAYRPGR